MKTFVHVADAEAHALRFPNATHGWDGPGLYNKDTGYHMELSQDREIKAPMVMRDIGEFVANAHYDRPSNWKPQLISSRSKLRAYERSNDLRQAGDFLPGEIMRGVTQKREKEAARANHLALKTGLRGPRKDFEWK